MNIAEITNQLEHFGYIVLAQPLDNALLTDLFARCHEDEPGRFHAAHIGRGATKKQIDSIRGDVINWLSAAHPADQAYLNWMEALRLSLNETLYLGLFEYECHYAIYNSGNGYAKHLDVLTGRKNRILSTVLYLNQNWQAGDGGELVLYQSTGENVIIKINPTFGTMVLFLSDAFPHEVLISHKTRRSVAGWFRVSGNH